MPFASPAECAASKAQPLVCRLKDVRGSISESYAAKSLLDAPSNAFPTSLHVETTGQSFAEVADVQVSLRGWVF